MSDSTDQPAAERSRSTPPPWYLMVPSIVCGIGVLLPIGYLVVRALDTHPERLWSTILDWRNVWLLVNTLLLAVGVLALTTLIAVPAAWLTARSDLPGRRIFAALLILPLAVPGYLMAFALLAIGGDYGALARMTEGAVSVPRVRFYVGALIALSLCNFPYMVLNVRAALHELDPGLEEIAHSLGHRPLKAFFTVVLPQLRPALLAGSLLIGLHVIMDFGVVSLMGYETLSYALYQRYSSAYDTVGAAWIALMMIGVSGAFIVGELMLLKGLRLHRAGSSLGRVQRPVPIHRWKIPAAAYLSLIVVASVAMPVVTIGYWASQADLAWLRPELLDAVRHSLWASVPAALVATLLALPVAYMARRYPSKRSLTLERVAFLGYATPSLAFALGLVVISLRLDEWLGVRRGETLLYQSLTVLVYAYSLHFLAEAVGPIRASLFHATPRVEEASRSLGVGPVATFFRVTLPLLRSGLIVSLALVFLSAMKELPLTILLKPLGVETLATNIWSYADNAMYAEAAPFALVILGLSLSFVGVLLWAERPSRYQTRITPEEHGWEIDPVAA